MNQPSDIMEYVIEYLGMRDYWPEQIYSPWAIGQLFFRDKEGNLIQLFIEVPMRKGRYYDT